MTGYRDELSATRHRITTLEAQLAERDASLHAREAELAELLAEVARLRTGAAPAEPRRSGGPIAALLMVAVVLAGLLGTGYLSVRGDAARAQAEATRAESESARARTEAERATAEAERARADLELARMEASRRAREERAPDPLPASADPEATAILNINSIPVSKVMLDGKALGSTPKVGLSVVPGQHVVTFIHPELGKKTVTLQIRNNETKTAAVKFR